MNPKNLVLLGVGNSAQALAHLSQAEDPSVKIYGTTRSAEKCRSLQASGIESLLDNGADFAERLAEVGAGASVLVSFPPQSGIPVDRRYGPLLQSAARIIYISSTGVYGRASGVINEETEPQPFGGNDNSASRLAAEEYWLSRGACVLRAPGLYGPSTGLHRRLQAGLYRLPGDGGNYVSRIHLDDLARIVDRAFTRLAPGSLYVVGDLRPSTHLETVSWLCERLNLPLPPSIPLDDPELSHLLRGNRQIDPSKILADLDLNLLYPTFVEGFSQCLR